MSVAVRERRDQEYCIESKSKETSLEVYIIGSEMRDFIHFVVDMVIVSQFH